MTKRDILPCGHWVERSGGVTRVGLTKEALLSVGQVTYIELPREQSLLSREEVSVVLETGKAAIDLEAPIEGKVLARNEGIINNVDLLNTDPEGEGWLYEVL